MFSLNKIINSQDDFYSSCSFLVRHQTAETEIDLDLDDCLWLAEINVDKNFDFIRELGCIQETRTWNVKFSQLFGYHNVGFDMLIVVELINQVDGRVLWRRSPQIIKSESAAKGCQSVQSVMGPKLLFEATIRKSIEPELRPIWIKSAVRVLIFTKDAELPINPAAETLSMMQNYKELFEKKEDTDITVKCSDGVEIQLHKFPLAVRSTVFKAMFNIEMTEKHAGAVHIKDFDSKVLNELFRFIYCNEAKINNEIVVDLLEAAKRYDIADLPEICEKFIIENIKGVDIWEVLKLAHMYDLQQLFVFIVGVFYASNKFYSSLKSWKEHCNVSLKLKVEEFLKQEFQQVDEVTAKDKF